MHWHNSLEILYVIEGDISLESVGRRGQITVGDLVINNIGEEHAVVSEEDSTLIAVQIPEHILRTVFSNAYPGIERDQFHITPEEKETPYYKELVFLILELNNEVLRDEPEILMLYANIYRILYILEHYCHYRRIESKYAELKDSFERILYYVQSNFKSPITREELAELSGYSPQYVSQLFRKNLGMTMQEYLNNLRLETARRDLMSKNDSITSIIHENGFSSPKYFTKIFKEKYGVSAREFRKNAATIRKSKGEREEIPEVYGYQLDSHREQIRITGDSMGDLGVSRRINEVDFGEERFSRCQLFKYLVITEPRSIRKAYGRIELERVLQENQYSNVLLRISGDDLKSDEDLHGLIEFFRLKRMSVHLLIPPDAFLDPELDQIIKTMYSESVKLFVDYSASPVIKSVDQGRLRSIAADILSGIAFAPEQVEVLQQFGLMEQDEKERICTVLEKEKKGRHFVNISIISEKVDVVIISEETGRSSKEAASLLKLCYGWQIYAMEHASSFSVSHSFLARCQCDSTIFFEQEMIRMMEYQRLFSNSKTLLGKSKDRFGFVFITEDDLEYDAMIHSFRVRGIPEGEYYIQSVSINGNYGNAALKWMELGSDDLRMDRDIEDHIIKISQPLLRIEKKSITNERPIMLTFPTNAVNYVRLSQRNTT